MTAAELEQLRAEVDELCEHTNAMFRVAGIFYEAGWSDAVHGAPAGQPAARPRHLQVVPGGT